VKVFLDRPSLSLNRLMRMHHTQVKRFETGIRWQIRANLARLRKEGVEPKATGKRSVHLTRIGAKLLDEDNLAGAKPIIDALVKEGLLVDDSPQWANIVFSQVQSKDPSLRRTVIELEEME